MIIYINGRGMNAPELKAYISELEAENAELREKVESAERQKTEYKLLLKAAAEDMYNSVNDVHCKYCSKWHTDQCQGTSHLDCYVENKFNWRYADEALALIGEEGVKNE